MGPTLICGVGGPAGSKEAVKQRTFRTRRAGPALICGVGGPAGSKEAVKQHTFRTRPVGPTLILFSSKKSAGPIRTGAIRRKERMSGNNDE